MSKLNYLNVGCGSKWHRDWTNIDLNPSSPEVIACDLSRSIPFEDNRFQAVYLSQVLEHFPKNDAPRLIGECRRVLQPEGIIRIVVPDLEDIAKNYLRFLDMNVNDPSEQSRANYDWMLLELYDQTVRNAGGGEMAEFLRRKLVVNERFVLDRIGLVGREIRDGCLRELGGQRQLSIKEKLYGSMRHGKWIKEALCVLRSLPARIVLTRKQKECLKIGEFRLSGEIHYWMYDRYSLARLLENCRFRDVKIKTPFDSDIPEWNKYELDVKNGQINDPTSLFVEARK